MIFNSKQPTVMFSCYLPYVLPSVYTYFVCSAVISSPAMYCSLLTIRLPSSQTLGEITRALLSLVPSCCMLVRCWLTQNLALSGVVGDRSAVAGLEILEEQDSIGGTDGHLCEFTSAYCAPEVVTDRVFNVQADIWALGCVVAQMSTGLDNPWQHAINTPDTPLTPHSESPDNVLRDNHVWRPPNEEFAVLATVGEPCYMCHLQRGLAPPMPSSLSQDGSSFVQLCWTILPNDRPTAASLLEHPHVTLEPALALAQQGTMMPGQVAGFSSCDGCGQLNCDGQPTLATMHRLITEGTRAPFVLYSERRLVQNIQTHLDRFAEGTHLLLSGLAVTHQRALRQLTATGKLSCCIASATDLAAVEQSALPMSMCYLHNVIMAHTAFRKGFLGQAINGHMNFLLHSCHDLQLLRQALNQDTHSRERIQVVLTKATMIGA